MNDTVFFAIICQMFSAAIIWGVIILVMGWYVRRQIKRAFSDEKLNKYVESPKGSSVWEQTQSN